MLLLMTLLPSKISRQWVGPQTKCLILPKFITDSRCLTIDVCGRAHHGPVCFSCFLASDRHYVCFTTAVLFICFTVMFHRRCRRPPDEVSRKQNWFKSQPSPSVFVLLIVPVRFFSSGSSVCVCGDIYGVRVVLIYSYSIFHLVPRSGDRVRG